MLTTDLSHIAKSLRMLMKKKLFLLVFLLLLLNLIYIPIVERKFLTAEELEHLYAGELKEDYLISFEEDGRFGNLLLETATLLLLGRQVDRPVHILPQVGRKMLHYLDNLPLPMVDTRKHCVCGKCTECLCDMCNTWQKINSDNFTRSTEIQSKYVLLQWYHADLVMKNIQEMAEMYKSYLRKSIVNQVQDYLQLYKSSVPTEFVGIHVRRTDYLPFISDNFKFTVSVDERYFKHCINYFRQRFENVQFFVTSDDVPWCEEKLSEEPNVHFPKLNGVAGNTPQQDFILMSQMNHTIYEFGSFGLWSAALAGGITLVADNYSNREHNLQTAIRLYAPENWIRVDVSKIL